MKKTLLLLITIFSLSLAKLASATIIIPMYTVYDESPVSIGYIKADDSIYGLMLTPFLYHLRPGVHGFHIHEMPFCNSNGLAAGGHLDPTRTNSHRGPYENGHLGDLPVLIVDGTGHARLPVLAPRLKLCDIQGRSILIDACGDNYRDCPRKSGGGGMRIACGVINYF